MRSWACDPPIFEVSMGPSELFNFILTKCNIVSRPPKDLILNPLSYCRDESDLDDFTVYIDKCNITGEWQIYDADIDSACLFSCEYIMLIKYYIYPLMHPDLLYML